MSFSVNHLRALFSFPGESDDREVDVFLTDPNGGGVGIGDISGPGQELGDNIAMSIALPDGYFLTIADPQKISAPQWFAATAIGEFANKWVLVQLSNGADFGKFVPDGNVSGKWYDASGNELKSWPNWAPVPSGTSPDPHLATTLPEPPNAPLTMTVLQPVTDKGALSSLLMFALAKQDGFDLKSPAQPEWTQYEGRADAALQALQDIDQLRSFLPRSAADIL